MGLLLPGSAIVLPAAGGGSGLSGLDAARPAPSAPGRTYDATDTAARYLDTGTAWRVSSAGGGPDLATLQGWSDASYLSGGTGAAVGPAGGPGWTFVACVYVTTLPGAFRAFATYSLDGGARGWVLGIGQTTADCLSLGHVNAGPTNVILQTGAVAPGWHKVGFALAADGLSAQWSLDGGAAQTVVIALGSYVAPDASSLFALGRFSYSNYTQADLGVAAIVAYQAVLTGGQLAAITATPSDGRLLTPSSVNEDFAFRAALAVDTSGGVVCAGATPRTLVRVGSPRLFPR
ncbi:MAG: hypothetical protein JWM10_2998 [Myxococcaceae bacterium]|nr:hypothetical protein [Myxococcaceae bacterium]